MFGSSTFRAASVGVALGILVGAGIAVWSGYQFSAVGSGSIFSLDGPTTFTAVATLLAGIIGAAIGGVVSHTLAAQAAKEQQRRDALARVLEEKTLALSVLATTAQLVNRLSTLQAELAPLSSICPGMQAYGMIGATPMQSNSRPRYVANEFVPFVNAGRTDVMNDAFMLADRVDALDAAQASYSDLRLELEKLLAPHSVYGAEGRVDSFVPEELVPLKCYYEEKLNRIAYKMRDSVMRDHDFGTSLLKQIETTLQQRFGVTSFGVKRSVAKMRNG